MGRDSVLGHRDENIKDTFSEELLKHSHAEVWLSQGLEWNISAPEKPQGENTCFSGLFDFKDFLN